MSTPATRPFLRRGPSGPLMPALGVIQTGYDIIAEELEIAAPGPFVPRNAALDPLQVTFPDFAVGNTLEVDFTMNGTWASETPDTVQLRTTVEISLDGGTTFYFLSPSSAACTVTPAADNDGLFRSLSSIKIEDPMPVLNSGVPGTIPLASAPIVRVAYDFPAEGTFFVNGAPEEFTLPGGILKCSEIAADSVFQGPQGQLATT